mgnify:CR=1 FL=1
MKTYNLYGSEGCHLCEQALSLCLSVIPKDKINQIDIIDQEKVPHESKTLVELYGVHIPVLEQFSDAGNTKLFWPFTAEQIKEL